MNDIFITFFNVFMMLWGHIDELFTPISDFIQSGFETFIPKILTLADWFLSNLTTFIKWANDTIGGTLSKIGNWISVQWNDFLNLFKDLNIPAGGVGGRPRATAIIMEVIKWMK